MNTHFGRLACLAQAVLLLCPILAHAKDLSGAALSQQDINDSSDRQYWTLDRQNRRALAVSRTLGEKQVALVIAARYGANDKVVQTVKTIGGLVEYRDDEVSYLRVTVPLDKVEYIAGLETLAACALDIDGADWASFDYYTLSAELPRYIAGVNSNGLPPAPPVAADAGRQFAEDAFHHRPSPLADLGAAELRREHPTYDGRGITVAQLEDMPNIKLPEFEEARSLEGIVVPKVVDIWTGNPAGRATGLTAFWAKMDREVTADGTEITMNGRLFVLPRPGRFLFGYCDLSRVWRKLADFAAGGLQGGKFPPDPAHLGVLWDPKTNEVWVDTNGEDSFANQRAMKDYHVNHDLGLIGHDDPVTYSREEFVYAVQTDPAQHSLAVMVGWDGHSTMTAGSAVGSHGPHGGIDGVAPGAQLINIDPRQNTSGHIEAMIQAFRDPRVDMLYIMRNVQMLYGRLPKNGQHPMTIITERLVKRYDKPILAPSSNVPGTGMVAEDGDAPNVIEVGVWESQKVWLNNMGFAGPHEDSFHMFGSWGPNGLGGVKPDLVAPAGFIAPRVNNGPGATPTYAGISRLPADYYVGGGTSQGTPILAGAMALLMSAAKQEHLPYDAETIRRALTDSGKYLPHLQAHQQGNGAVNVTAALDLLRQYAQNHNRIEIRSSAPVRTADRDWLAKPGVGVGLWERGGWQAGDKAERIITLERLDGPDEMMAFDASWRGNDGTFMSAPSVSLPLRQPVSYPVTVAPTKAGTHSALLTLDHSSVPGHVHRLLATIMVGEQLTPQSGYSLVMHGLLEATANESRALDVPPGTEALFCEPVGRIFLTMLNPKIEFVTIGYRDHGQVVLDPRPGTWELAIQDLAVLDDKVKADVMWRTAPGMPSEAAPYQIRLSALAAQVDVPAINVQPASAQTFTATVHNKLAEFDGGLVPMSLGTTRIEKLHLRQGEQRVMELMVPAGSPVLWAMLEKQSHPDADVDLYLISGTKDKNAGAALRPGDDRNVNSSRASVLGQFVRARQKNPSAGLWKIVIDASRVPPDGIDVTYTDIVTDPTLGTITFAEGIRHHASDSRWQTTGNIWLAKSASEGRSPVAILSVEAQIQGASVPIGTRILPLH